MKIILKVIKWLFVFLIISFVFLLTSIYISSLNWYKESDFNIPKDFFITKFWDKDPYSKENWFEDFVKFNDELNNFDLQYFNIESKCLFEKEKINEWQCEEFRKSYIKSLNNKDIELILLNFENFVDENQIKYAKINNKEYILQIDENQITYWWLIDYSKSLKYLSYRYFEEWNYDKWLKILLDFQLFIDNLINKYDWDLFGSLVIIDINKINLEWLIYIIDHYNLSKELKFEITKIIKPIVWEWLIKNWLKGDYKIYNKNLSYTLSFYENINIDDNNPKYKSIKSIIEIILFSSKNETELLFKKMFFDLITHKESVLYNNICDNQQINLNNYIWRKVFCSWWIWDYKNEFKKEQSLFTLRTRLLEKVK